MRETSDRRFDWVAGLAVASGVGVMVPSSLCPRHRFDSRGRAAYMIHNLLRHPAIFADEHSREKSRADDCFGAKLPAGLCIGDVRFLVNGRDRGNDCHSAHCVHGSNLQVEPLLVRFPLPGQIQGHPQRPHQDIGRYSRSWCGQAGSGWPAGFRSPCGWWTLWCGAGNACRIAGVERHCPRSALIHNWTLFSLWSDLDRVANSFGVRPRRLVCGRCSL